MKETAHSATRLCPDGNHYENGPRQLAGYILENWASLCDTGRTGLYVLTSDAGFEASVSLWKQTLIDSPRFVNPSPFPFTLSCSPAGYITQLCRISGPSYTFVGPITEMKTVLGEIEYDLMCGIIENALLLVPGPMYASRFLDVDIFVYSA